MPDIKDNTCKVPSKLGFLQRKAATREEEKQFHGKNVSLEPHKVINKDLKVI